MATIHAKKQSELAETKYVLKSKTTNPEPAPAGLDSLGTTEPAPAAAPAAQSSSEKPFNDVPFDAGVQADEETDPKKYIQQLAGKLGNSLRKYNKGLGQPDFETEKFAINSVISATHTSEMDQNDQNDIIKKVKSSGAADQTDNQPQDDNQDMGNQDMGNQGGDNQDMGNQDNQDNQDINLNAEGLIENFSTFVENTEMTTPEVKPLVKPTVKPEIKPHRRSKPFKVPVIAPGTSPAPKANK